MKAAIYSTILFTVLYCTQIQAGYDANIQGTVTHVLTYTSNARIYVRLDTQPSSHPTCTANYFVIDAATPDPVRSQLLARLLTAYTTGEVVNIGYDSQGDCSHGRIRIHRIG